MTAFFRFFEFYVSFACFSKKPLYNGTSVELFVWVTYCLAGLSPLAGHNHRNSHWRERQQTEDTRLFNLFVSIK